MGRPRLEAAARRSCQIEILVTVEERARLRQVAAENRLPMTAMMREAINEYVSDYGERAVFFPPTRSRTPTKD
jgi:hypothetical protein